MADDSVDNLTLLHRFADILGASEPAIRLLLSLLIGYPLVHIHKKYLHGTPPILQHLFFIISGLAIGLFNCGFGVIHSVICIVAAWLVSIFIGGTQISVVVTFIFQMGYLVVAYYITGTDTYDIKWTMPQCVLTLRLIALSFDMYDGSKKPEELSNDQKKTALTTSPSLIEIASHIYYPASVMVGPQFSMRRYQDYIHRKLYPKNTTSSEKTGLLRGLLGLIYLAIYQVGITYIPDSYLISEQFMISPFWSKMLVIGFWGKITLYKYVSCWLITEGACIYSGLAYSGVDDEGNAMWKGCANIKLRLFETGPDFGSLIQAFNMNTNSWVAQYVYKRLKCLNNRYLSQMAALLFLALWHGLHSGYYSCFFLEFLIMYFERNFTALINKYPKITAQLQAQPLSILLYIIMKMYVIVFMGYCLGSFVLLKSHRWWVFYSSCYFVGHIFFGGWIVYKPLLKILLRKYGGPPLSAKGVDATERKEK